LAATNIPASVKNRNYHGYFFLIIGFVLQMAAFVSFGWGLQLGNCTWGTSNWSSPLHRIETIACSIVMLVFLFASFLFTEKILHLNKDDRSTVMLYSLILGVPLGYYIRSRFHKNN